MNLNLYNLLMLNDKLRNDFPQLKIKNNNHNLVYLDSAATTLKPQKIINSITEYYEKFSCSTGRGNYFLSSQLESRVSESTKSIAKFLNCDEEEIVFSYNTTYLINIISKILSANVKENDEIILSHAEHSSNLLPWYMIAKAKKLKIKFCPFNEDLTIGVREIKSVISPKTKIVSLAHMTNVLGNTIDVNGIGKFLKERNIYFVVDGAQSISYYPVDIKKIQCDFYVFSAHKMCGPTGLGIMYGRREILEKSEAVIAGGHMLKSLTTDGSHDFTVLSSKRKWQPGTSNYAAIFAMKEVINYLQEIGVDNIRKHCIELKKYLVSEFKKLPNIVMYNEKLESSILTFNVKNCSAEDVSFDLSSKGICVRHGDHCSKILKNVIKTQASLRISFYLYNRKEEIDYLVKQIKEGKDFLNHLFE